MGCGSNRRGGAVPAITSAAATIIALSTPAQVLRLGVPVGVLLSAGLSAQRNASIATTAATRLTTDSAASESRPTEPVTNHAVVFRAIVAAAAAIESHSNLNRRSCPIRHTVCSARLQDRK